MKELVINSDKSLDDLIQHLRDLYDKHKYLRIGVKTGKQRSNTQNAAIHVYCELLAQAFNDAGLDMVTVLSEGAEIPWSMHKVKEDIWRKVQLAVVDKKSTTQLDRWGEIDQIYDVINRHVSSTFGIFVPFPKKDKDV